MKKLCAAFTLFLMLVCLLVTSMVYGQATNFTLQGTVKDATGTPVGGGFTVEAINQRVPTGWLAATVVTTRDDGTYTILFLDPFGGRTTHVNDEIRITVTDNTGKWVGGKTYIVTQAAVDVGQDTVDILLVTNIVLNEIQYRVTDRVEIKNRGGITVDISNWQLCSRFVYAPLSALTVDFGSTNLAPGTLVVLSGFSLNDTSADLALYSAPLFGNPDSMESFVQWGSSGLGRESIAVTRGIWTAGDFIPTVADNHSIEYDGSGQTSSDWFDQATPTFGDDNSLAVG